MLTWSVVIIAAQAFAQGGGEDRHGKLSTIERDPVIQQQIEDVLNPPAASDKVEQWRRYEALWRKAWALPDEAAQFVQQVILYVVENEPDARHPAAYELLEKLRVDESKYAIALGPLLYSDNDRLRREAWRLFPRMLECPGERLSAFRTYLTGSGRTTAIADPLTRAVFQTLPGEALLLFHRETDPQDVLPHRRAERIIDNALFEKRYLGGIPGGRVDEETAKALRDLGESKYWWARLFAAEIMVQNKEFRDPALIERLWNDESPVVHRSMMSLDGRDPLRATPVDR